MGNWKRNGRWKRNERDTAALLGGTRVPITGRQRGDAPDIAHDWLSIECKSREVVPNWLLDGLAQARAAQKSELHLPIVVVHKIGERHSNDLVVMSLKDFNEWFGKSKESTD